ncbi:MAG: beta-lactamase family protein [Saprospiraceae bacterium]|nr:beta-lactamase family protein [Saprospiraceae bacterium]
MKNILFFLVLSASTLLAQTNSIQKSPFLTDAKPESVGMSSERLQRIDALLQKSIDQKEIPGAVAIVCRNGKIVYHKAFGTADAASGRAFKTDDIFRIASMSKAITSTAVMMLWEEGLFQLDDPISKYIPEFKNPSVLDSLYEADSTYTVKPAGKEITIRHLLTHTSGLGYGVIDGDARFKKIYKKAGIVDLFTTESVKIGDNIKKLAKLPLHHVPGEKYVYSEGLDVLGYFIEVISGMPFDVYLKTHIFDPLSMNDTYFYLPSEKANRLVKIQTKTDDKWTSFTDNFYDPDYPIKGAKTFFSGGAGLSSTAKDYATFLQMYLNNGELNGKRLLSRKTIESMMMNQVGDLLGGAKSDQNYGLAFGLLTTKGMSKGGLGSENLFTWGGYFNTNYFADPKEKIIGVIMKQTQKIDDKNNSGKFRAMVMQAVDN